MKPQYRYISLWYHYVDPFTNETVKTNERGFMILKDDKQFEVHTSIINNEEFVSKRVAQLNGVKFFEDISPFREFEFEGCIYMKLPLVNVVKTGHVNAVSGNNYTYFSSDIVVKAK